MTHRHSLTRAGVTLAALTLLAACSGADAPLTSADISGPDVLAVEDPIDALESDETGPIDGGQRISTKAVFAPRAAVDAHIVGEWSQAASWPLSPIHAVLLADGRVMTYGTDAAGNNGTGFIHDIWDWRQGLTEDAHLTLPHQTGTNIFCSAQGILPGSGSLMITGGDERGLPDGTALWGVNDANIYDPVTGQMRRLADSMRYDRWYPTMTGLPNGDQFIQGGRSAKGMAAPMVPEVYSERNGWRVLTGLADAELYAGSDWFYPRSFVMPDGRVLMMRRRGRELVAIDTRGTGSVQTLGNYTGNIGTSVPAAMYDIGKILAMRTDGSAFTVDVNGAQPVVQEAAASSGRRIWSDATVLPDGQVLITGGARVSQSLADAVNTAELWNPATDSWTRGASGAKARLYHSTSLLLPDATVLVAGGGPPGPVVNLNAEVYRPPYLYRRDGSGQLAERPTIVSAGAVRYGRAFAAEVGSGQQIERVTLVRSGSATHSFDQSQRLVPLTFEQNGTSLTINGPQNRRIAPPGTYLLFVIDENGVPSVARMVQLASPAAAAAPVQTGSFDLAANSRNDWIKVAFEKPFAKVPAVVIGQLTERGGDPVTTKVRNVTRTGFEVALDEWQYLDGWHATERLTFLAAEPGLHDLNGLLLQARRVNDVGARWRSIRFASPFATQPVALAQRVSERDFDAVTVRLNQVRQAGLQVRLQTEEAGNAPGGERVDIIAIGQGRGRLANLPVAVARHDIAVDERWSALGYGRVYPETPHVLAAAQTTRGGDPIVMRSRGAMPASVELRLQEETSADAETNHVLESVGIVTIRRR